MYVNDKQSDKRGGRVGKRVGEVDLSHFPPKYFAYYWLHCGAKGYAYILFI